MDFMLAVTGFGVWPVRGRRVERQSGKKKTTFPPTKAI